MLTLIIILLVISLIRGENSNSERKSDKIMVIGILSAIEIITIVAGISNIIEAPNVLEEEYESLSALEDEFESLNFNFTYTSQEKENIQDLYLFEDKYEELEDKIAALKDDIARNERRADPNSNANRIGRFLLDFGIFSRKVWSILATK